MAPKGHTAAQKEGLRYERKVGKALEQALGPANVVHNPWFTFEDAAGQAYCCPDFIVTIGWAILVVEVKLSYVDEAILKLRKLYCPVVSFAFGELVQPLVVCRYLTPMAPRAEDNVEEAISLPIPLLHWSGLGPLRII